MTDLPTWLDPRAAAILTAGGVDPRRLDRVGDPYRVPDELRKHYAAAALSTSLSDLGRRPHGLEDVLDRVRAGEAVIRALGGDGVPEPRSWNLNGDRRVAAAERALADHRVDVDAWRVHARLLAAAGEAAERARVDAENAARWRREASCVIGGHVDDTTVRPRRLPWPGGDTVRLCDGHAAAVSAAWAARFAGPDVEALVDTAPDLPAPAPAVPSPAVASSRRWGR